MRTKLEIASRMVGYRAIVKHICGDEYEERIKTPKQLIQDKNTDILTAVTDLCNEAKVKKNDFAIMLFMSAAADLIETSK